jgi:tetratricopeptide (TPR) repeat protein
MTIRCAQCGLESQVEAAFHVERGWFSAQHRAYCPTCQHQRALQSARKTILGGLFFSGFSIAQLIGFNFHPMAWWPVRISFAFLLCIPLILLHELAHASMARWLGLRVYAMVIGYGKTWLKGRLGEIDWEFRLIPLGGMTGIATPPGPFYRLRLFLALLAGPAVHLFLALLAGLALAGTHPASILHGFWQVFFYTNLGLLLISIYPEKVSSPYGETGTDGYKLLAIPFWKQEEIDRHTAAYFIQEGLRAIQRKDLPAAQRWLSEGQARYPGSLLMQNGLGFLLFHIGQYAAARQTFLDLFAMQHNPPPEVKYMALNNIAYANLFLKETALLTEAQQYSAEAYQNMPWMPAIVGTRGAVLVESGEIADGLALLRQAMSEHTDPHSKALNACHIAIGESRLGHRRVAEEYLQAARALDPHCFLLNQAEKEVYTP